MYRLLKTFKIKGFLKIVFAVLAGFSSSGFTGEFPFHLFTLFLCVTARGDILECYLASMCDHLAPMSCRVEGCGQDSVVVGPAAAGDGLMGEVRPTLRKMAKNIKWRIFKDTCNQFLGLKFLRKLKAYFIVLSFYHLLVKTFGSLYVV